VSRLFDGVVDSLVICQGGNYEPFTSPVRCDVALDGSEKKAKHAYHRRFRRVTKYMLRVRPDPEELPHWDEYSHPWDMPKDSNHRFDMER
jgi:hypothetical protein